MREIIAICVIGAILLCGCLNIEEKEEKEPPMFIVVERQTNWDVVYHKDTKVMYAISRGGYNQGNFTVLVNADGTPMLWEGGEE